MKTTFVAATVAMFFSFAVQAIEYEADILPILESRCKNCHMEGSSKGGVALDLDKIDREIGSGKAIVPGDSGKSDLYEVVSLPDDDGDKMPPEGKGRPLSDAELSKLKEWIDSGAQVGSEKPEMTESEEEKPEAGLASRPEPVDGNWTNTTGKTIQATLVRVDGDKAILRMNGKDYPYPISSLNSEGQAIVKEFADAWKKAGG